MTRGATIANFAIIAVLLLLAGALLTLDCDDARGKQLPHDVGTTVEAP